MQLLLSMSCATPETRLILLTWAARLGDNFQSGTREALALALGVSKRHLATALEYLEQEGYLWKIKTPFKRPEGDKSKVRFDYALSKDCWRMWIDSLATCAWHDELVSVLNGKSLAETQSTKSTAGLNVNARLVWAVLLIQSNNGRYVIGRDDSSICQLTGISKLALLRSINSLVRKEVITIVANGVERSKLLPYLPPIYKLQRQQPNTKVIKFGVPLSDTFIIPLRCISRLTTYYKRACKLPKGKYPNQNTLLNDQQYFQLSEFFQSKALVRWIDHFCLSTIISLTPWHVSSNDHANRTTREVSDELRFKIMATYLDGFGDGWHSLTSSDYADDNTITASNSTEMDILKNYLLEALTDESMDLILELSRSWRLFVECMGENGRIVDYRQRDRMVSIGHQLVHQNIDSEDEEQKLNVLADQFTSCVLTIVVPDSNSYSDCMALRDCLLTSNINLKHSRINHVQHLIHGANSHELAKIRHSLISDQSEPSKLPS